MCAQSCPALHDPMDFSLPGSSVCGIFQQEHLSGLPFPPPGHLPNPGIEPTSPLSLVIIGGFLPLSHLGSPCVCSSVQSLSHVRLFATLWITARQASLSITNSRSLLKLMAIESVMPSSHLILCCPLLLLPPIPPSIRVFSNESTLHMRWPKYWSFSFSISSSNECSGLTSFRMNWLDLLAVQGTLKSSPTPQFKSINSSALSVLHNPTLTSIHDHWKNHSLDQTDFCWQSNVSAF